jgi:hypothetical protein
MEIRASKHGKVDIPKKKSYKEESDA